MTEQIKGIISMLVLYGVLWAANMVFGIANNLSKGEKWDWRRFFAGWRTAILGATGMALTIGAVLFIPEVFKYNNIQIGEEWQKATSLLAILAGLAGGVLSYAKKAVGNIIRFLNPDKIASEIQIKKDEWNKGQIIFKEPKELHETAEAVEVK